MYPDFALMLMGTGAGTAGFLAGLIATRAHVRRVTTEAEQARWHADHDALTGLPNRTAARHTYQRAAKAGLPCSVVLLDLDDFKTVNDTWGHQAGDAHLVAIAERLAASCCAVGATACRLGGDEFLLLVPSADPQAVMRQIMGIVGELGAALPLRIDENTSVTTFPGASAGIAVAEPGEAFSDLLRHADIALYHAKTHSTATRLYTPELRQPSSHRHKGGDVLGTHPEGGWLAGRTVEQVPQ